MALDLAHFRSSSRSFSAWAEGLGVELVSEGAVVELAGVLVDVDEAFEGGVEDVAVSHFWRGC